VKADCTAYASHMRNTPVPGHPLRIVEPETAAAPADVPARRSLGLSWLDRLPLAALVSDDPSNLLEEVRASAEALAGEDPDAARLRMLSRLLAGARAQVQLLEALLAERVAKRDLGGVEIINKALAGASKRLALWLAEHRASSASGRRAAVVVVGNAQHVTVRHGQ
jgi:hypothetical protein